MFAVSLSSARSMRPKEHGAYGELGFPLLTSLLIGRVTIGVIALTIAAVAAFVAHEPLLIRLGLRGARAKVEDGPRALRFLGVLCAIALAAGVTGIALGGRQIGLAVALPIALVLALRLGRWHFPSRPSPFAG